MDIFLVKRQPKIAQEPTARKRDQIFPRLKKNQPEKVRAEDEAKKFEIFASKKSLPGSPTPGDLSQGITPYVSFSSAPPPKS